MTLYHYRGADGIWRDRCAAHVKHSGPYQAVTPLVASQCRICVECFPWGSGAHVLAEDKDHDPSQLERIAETEADITTD